jgi:hypothetical protein
VSSNYFDVMGVKPMALFGGVLGWALAYPGVDVIRAAIPLGPYPINYALAPDSYVLNQNPKDQVMNVCCPDKDAAKADRLAMNGVSHAAGGAESNEKTDGGKEQPFTAGIFKAP